MTIIVGISNANDLDKFLKRVDDNCDTVTEIKFFTICSWLPALDTASFQALREGLQKCEMLFNIHGIDEFALPEKTELKTMLNEHRGPPP